MSVAHINPLTFSSPNSISGCSLWLDANDPTTVTFSSGSNVSTWIDKSGSNNNHSNAVGSVTYSGNTMNFPGTACLSNSSVNGYSFGATSPITTFLVFSYSGFYTGSNAVMFSYGQVTCSQTGYVLYVDAANSNYTGTVYCAVLMVRNPILTNTQYIVSDSMSYTGSSGSFNRAGWINGSNLITTNASTTGVNLTNSGGSTVGYDRAGAYMYGTISELIYYNTTLTTAQRQNIEGYLAQKWGQTSKLPSFHPGVKSPLYPSLTQNRMLNSPKTGIFYPPSIAGCQVWLDASDPTLFSYSSGSVIQQWNDKSGNGLHAYSNSVIGWQAPSYVSGNPSYVSLQPNQALYVPNFPYTTAWSVFSCMNNVTLGARWYISPYSDLSIVLMGMSQPGNKVWAGILAGDGDITGSHVEYTSAQNTNGTGIYSYFRDGTQISINTIGNSVGAATVRMGIGANGASGYDIGGTYYPYEILFYNQYLGSNDRQMVEGYLAWKWSLQNSLPAGHPYKSAAPGSTSRLPMRAVINLPRYQYSSSGLVITHQDGRSWKVAGSAIYLNTGTTMSLTIYAGSDVYNSANGRVGLFNNGNSSEAVRHASYVMYTNPFTANNYDFAWYFVSSGSGYLIYNDYPSISAWQVSYDPAQDRVLITAPGSGNYGMVWNITPKVTLSYVYKSYPT